MTLYSAQWALFRSNSEISEEDINRVAMFAIPIELAKSVVGWSTKLIYHDDDKLKIPINIIKTRTRRLIKDTFLQDFNISKGFFKYLSAAVEQLVAEIFDPILEELKSKNLSCISLALVKRITHNDLDIQNLLLTRQITLLAERKKLSSNDQKLIKNEVDGYMSNKYGAILEKQQVDEYNNEYYKNNNKDRMGQ